MQDSRRSRHATKRADLTTYLTSPNDGDRASAHSFRTGGACYGVQAGSAEQWFTARDAALASVRAPELTQDLDALSLGHQLVARIEQLLEVGARERPAEYPSVRYTDEAPPERHAAHRG